MDRATTEHNDERMLLLLRNSSKKQAEKRIGDDGKIEYDIPLQRNILRPWAERLGYKIVGELVEGGISGYKISADKRDAIVELKAMANRGEFDVLGIYMSDRLGRIADETPLIVSYLNARGIKVLSYTDGEISANTHSEKLMTYIRFWQAEGESLKTSIRIKDAHGDAVEQGKWRGGCPPYGYDTVSRGTLNGKGRPIFDIEINPEASEIVKKIFKWYKEHHSTKNIAKMLNDKCVPTQKGGLWTPATVKGILKNKQYIGIYQLGKTTGKNKKDSPIMEHLKLISDEEFYEVQELLIKNRTSSSQVGKRPTVRGSRILSGLLFCECGNKYTSQTQIRRQPRKDGSVYVHEYSIYRCCSYLHPKDGQCNRKRFNADKLDEIITEDAKKFLLETDIEQLIYSQEDRIKEKEHEVLEQLKRMAKEISQKEKEIQKLKDEVFKVIMGESQFSQSLLSELVSTKEQELIELKKRQTELSVRSEELSALLLAQKATCSDLTNWSSRFDLQDTMDKKAMLINLIDKITIYKEELEVDYKVKYNYLWEDEKNDIMEKESDEQKTSNAFFYSQSVKRDVEPKTQTTV